VPVYALRVRVESLETLGLIEAESSRNVARIFRGGVFDRHRDQDTLMLIMPLSVAQGFIYPSRDSSFRDGSVKSKRSCSALLALG
jgi:hypothetical protein